MVARLFCNFGNALHSFPLSRSVGRSYDWDKISAVIFDITFTCMHSVILYCVFYALASPIYGFQFSCFYSCGPSNIVHLAYTYICALCVCVMCVGNVFQGVRFLCLLLVLNFFSFLFLCLLVVVRSFLFFSHFVYCMRKSRFGSLIQATF